MKDIYEYETWGEVIGNHVYTSTKVYQNNIPHTVINAWKEVDPNKDPYLIFYEQVPGYVMSREMCSVIEFLDATPIAANVIYKEIYDETI